MFATTRGRAEEAGVGSPDRVAECGFLRLPAQIGHESFDCGIAATAPGFPPSGFKAACLI